MAHHSPAFSNDTFYSNDNNYDIGLRNKITGNGGDKEHPEEKGSRFI